MLLRFIIAINFLAIAATATIENNGTTEPEYDDDSNTTEVGYPGMGEFNSTPTTERPTCSSDQWQCADGACVPQEHKCDGALHCEDGSDETRALCRGTQRQMLGLVMYCIADRTILKAGVCPEVCELQPQYCAYALLAEQESAPKGVCAFPESFRNGSYKVTNLNRTSASGYNDFYLDFKCNNRTELVGEPRSECVDGNWSNKFPYCSDTCKLNQKPGHKYTCKRDGKSKQCGEFVAIGTEVIVEKNDTTISNSSITTRAMCTDRLRFDVNSSCVEDVESRQDIFEKDTMKKLSEFEDKFKEIKQSSFAFEELVSNYRSFEAHASGNSTELSVQIAACDMNLDLMETHKDHGTY